MLFRSELLKALCGAGPVSIREAARRVHRDVKAVHGDVTALLSPACSSVHKAAELSSHLRPSRLSLYSKLRDDEGEQGEGLIIHSRELEQDAQKVLPARPQQAKRRGVPLWYVEPLREVRTPLEGFFSILLEAHFL